MEGVLLPYMHCDLTSICRLSTAFFSQWKHKLHNFHNTQHNSITFQIYWPCICAHTSLMQSKLKKFIFWDSCLHASQAKCRIPPYRKYIFRFLKNWKFQIIIGNLKISDYKEKSENFYNPWTLSCKKKPRNIYTVSTIIYCKKYFRIFF